MMQPSSKGGFSQRPAQHRVVAGLCLFLLLP
jgi:hypothetical protein